MQLLSPRTRELVKTVIMDVLTKWYVTNKLKTITSDNGSDMCAGLELARKKLKGKNLHIRSMTHIVNLEMKPAFRDNHSCISGMKKHVSAIRLYVKRRASFENLKRVLRKPSIILPSFDVETWWSSTYDVLAKAFEALSVLSLMLLEEEDSSCHCITDTHWTIESTVCDCLKTFSDVTFNQSGSQYVSLSMTSTIFKHSCDNVHNFTQMQFGYLHALGENLSQKKNSYKKQVNTEYSCMAKILNLRFANDGFTSEVFLRTYMQKDVYFVAAQQDSMDE